MMLPSVLYITCPRTQSHPIALSNSLLSIHMSKEAPKPSWNKQRPLKAEDSVAEISKFISRLTLLASAQCSFPQHLEYHQVVTVRKAVSPTKQ